jgi:hypothetical protein
LNAINNHMDIYTPHTLRILRCQRIIVSIAKLSDEKLDNRIPLTIQVPA